MAKRKIDLKVDELIDAIGQETRRRHPLSKGTPTKEEISHLPTGRQVV